MADDAQTYEAPDNMSQTLFDEIEAFNRQMAPAVGMFSMMAANVNSLMRVYIPGQIIPVQTSGAQVGVNYSMAHAHANGLLVIVQPYDNMKEGDWIEVFWGTSPIAVASAVVKADQVDQLLALYVPTDKVPGMVRAAEVPTPAQIAGVVADIYFQVTRAQSGNQEQSLKLSVLSRQVFPGGSDPMPDRPGHYNLLAPIAPTGVIGEPEADAGVAVTIAVYPNMRAFDSIRLSWGGEFVDYQIQPAQVGEAIVVMVTKEVILKAGDSDSVVLAYQVLDEVHNRSSDWSLRSFVSVEIGTGLMPEPFIENPDDSAVPFDVIDLNVLGEDDLLVTVNTRNDAQPFKVDDTVTVTWAGTTAAGQLITVPLAAQIVNRIGRTLMFHVPNLQLLGLGMGRGAASYVVTRSGSPPLNSKRAFVSFIGEARLMPAPLLLEAVEGVIEADSATATAQIPASAQLLRNDRVKLVWLGLRSDGTPLPYTIERTVTASQAGRDLNLIIDAPRNLKPLDGGSITLSYQITRRGLITPLPSQPSLIGVGRALSELPAPSTMPAFPTGVVTPGEHPGGIEVIVQIFPYMRDGQIITLYWEGEVGDNFTDNVEVYPGDLTYFSVDQAQLRSNENGQVKVYYTVSEPGQPERRSDDLVLTIGAAVNPELPQPQVLQAVDGLLDPANARQGATVRVPASAELMVGDEVVVYWDGDQPGSVAEVSEFVMQGQQGLAKDLTIAVAVVEASNNGNVVVRYDVFRTTTGLPDNSAITILRVQGSTLPVPIFIEAVGGNLNPGDVPNGATVLIDSAARLRTGDLVTVNTRSQGGDRAYPRTVQAHEAGQALRITVPYADIQAMIGSTVELYYSLYRAPDGPLEPSPSSGYTVNRVIEGGELRIFGARYSGGTYRASGSSRVLSAFNRQTLQPILAEWQYQGDDTWTPSYTWMDRQPSRPVLVRSANDAVRLNPFNVIGNGNDASVGGNAAYTAMIYNVPDTIGQFTLVSWGNAAFGGSGPGFDHRSVVEVSCTRSAFAARLIDGRLVCWGNPAEGGVLRPQDANRTFLDVRSNGTVFIGRYPAQPGSSVGRLTGWGTMANGADIPAPVLALTDIVEVFGAGLAFAAKRQGGTLVAWGQAANGGAVPAAIASRSDNIYIKGNYAAFAVRRADNSIDAWGNPSYGGVMPDQIRSRRDIYALEGATARAFTALTNGGQVLAWGGASHGGVVPANISAFTDIVEVTSTWQAFCARRRSGHVVVWGNPTNGGTLPADIARLSDIVQVTGSAWSFAALRRDGTVVAWGAAASGGNIDAVRGRLVNVRAIYANSNGFTALTSLGEVVTWGHPAGGGDSAAVQPLLRSRLRTGRTVPVPAKGLAAGSK